MRIGDMFYTSWGYDQTNYDFVVIVAMSPTGKSALCRMARLASNVPDGQCNVQVPKPEGYGDIFRMGVDGNNLRGSYPYIDGDCSRGKRLDTFYPHVEGSKYYETDPVFGH